MVPNNIEGLKQFADLFGIDGIDIDSVPPSLDVPVTRSRVFEGAPSATITPSNGTANAPEDYSNTAVGVNPAPRNILAPADASIQPYQKSNLLDTDPLSAARTVVSDITAPAAQQAEPDSRTQLTILSNTAISSYVKNDVSEDGDFDDAGEYRPVEIKTLKGSKTETIDPNAETWIVIHGNASNPDTGNIFDLASTVEAKVAEKKGQVLVIDWREPANNPDLNLVPNPAASANWIHDVADFAAQALRDVWKIDPSKINLIGHSLGTYVASELGFIMASRDEDRTNLNIDPEKCVNTLIALDPAATDPRSPLGYDLDGDTNDRREAPVPFQSVSKFSRAFWGDIPSGDGLGSPELAKTADETIYIDFKKPNGFRDEINPIDSHGNIVNLYRNMLSQPGMIGSLFQLDAGPHQEWKTDTYGGNEAILVASAYAEGNYQYLAAQNDPNTQPSLLFTKSANPASDDIAYGSTGNDDLEGSILDRNSLGGIANEATFNSPGNDELYGDTGSDKILGGSGNDTLYGNQGNDTVNGEGDDDLIYGGQDQDYLYGSQGSDKVYGDEGNDTLEGNDGSDTLVGGEDNDRIWGGGDSSADCLAGGADSDTLTGESGNDLLLGGAGADILEGNNDSDTLIGGKGKDTLDGGLGSDTFVLALGDGGSTVDDADFITNFRSGFLGAVQVGDARGVCKIGLAGDLKIGDIQVVSAGSNKTALFAQANAADLSPTIPQDEYLAVLDGSFTKEQIQFQENFLVQSF